MQLLVTLSGVLGLYKVWVALFQPMVGQGGFSAMYGGDSPYMDGEGLEPGEIVPGRPFLGPAIEWPKVGIVLLVNLVTLEIRVAFKGIC